MKSPAQYKQQCQEFSYKCSKCKTRHPKQAEKCFMCGSTDIFVYDPIKNSFKPVRNKNKDQTSLNTDALYCLLMDDTDNLWIGSFNGGVNILKS